MFMESSPRFEEAEGLYVFGIDWGRGEEQERKSNAETLRAQRGEAKI
jgi:hypothetical protein